MSNVMYKLTFVVADEKRTVTMYDVHPCDSEVMLDRIQAFLSMGWCDYELHAVYKGASAYTIYDGCDEIGYVLIEPSMES